MNTCKAIVDSLKGYGLELDVEFSFSRIILKTPEREIHWNEDNFNGFLYFTSGMLESAQLLGGK